MTLRRSTLFALFTILVLYPPRSFAAEFYVTPAGATNGNGSASSPWNLQTALNQPSAVKPGDTIWIRGGTYRVNNVPNKFTSQLTGATNAPITVRAYPGDRATIDGNISQFSGGWINFWGLEITDSFTNRTTTESGPWPDTWWETNAYGIVVDYCVSGFDLRAPGVKLINLVLHENVGGGLGVNTNATGSEVYGCLSYYNGWQGPDRGHGHGLYLQNAGPNTTRITDSMFFENYALGAQAYGSDSPIADYVDLEGNAFFMNGVLADSHQENFEVGPHSGMSRSPIIVSNCVYDTQGSSADTFIGYTGGTSNAVITGNYFATQVQFGPYANLTLTGNSFLSNTVVLVTNDFPNNIYQTLPPATGTKAIVRPNAYESGRANIIIYNWAQASTVSVDVSNIGLTVGAHYELHNVQNFYGDIVTGTYTGSPITVPMTGHTVAVPTSHGAPASTFPKFGAFVIVMVAPGSSPTTTGGWQIATTQCHSPILGVSAENDWDTPQTHTLVSNLQPAYVTMGIDWSAGATGDWSRADAQINLNKGWKIVVELNHTDNLTSNTVSNAVAAVIARYTNSLYAIEAYCEPSDDAQGITNYSRFFNQARGAIDNSGWKGIVRLAGPSRCNSEIDTFMGLVTNLIHGVTNIDLVDTHDYYAVPGNGGIPAPGDMSYIHPVSTNAQGHTLADRLGEMNHWQALTGKTNDRPVMSEYGLYDSDVQDAIDAARAFCTNNVAVTLWAPNIPVHSALPIGHQLPGPLWDKPITEFTRELCR